MKVIFRKSLCLLLAMLVLAFSAVSCESSEGGSNAADNGNSATNDVSEKPEEKSEPVYTISDEILTDNEYCTMTIKDAGSNSISGIALNVLCENKTPDKKLTFRMQYASVNGYMIEPYWIEDVTAGNKVNSRITFSAKTMKECGITSADDISFTLIVYDSDNFWYGDYFVNENHTIYPTGKTASEITIPERRTVADEKTITDNEYCTFIILDTYNDENWGYSINCYIENKSDKTIVASWDDVSVNGYMINPYWSTTIAPSKRCYSTISFFTDDFTVNNITDVENVDFKLRVYDSNDWLADNFVNSVFTYEPQQ